MPLKKCPGCYGSGKESFGPPDICGTCTGKGTVTTEIYNEYEYKKLKEKERENLLCKAKSRLYKLSDNQLRKILKDFHDN